MTMLINPYRHGSGGGGSFDPLSIAWDLAFWADDPDWTDPGDGGAVSTWRDAGSIGSDSTQATGSKQPTFRSSTAAFNSRATVEFDGTDEMATGLFPSDLTEPAELFMVAAATGDTGLGQTPFFQGDASHRWGILRYFTGGDVWRIFQGGSVTTGGAGDANAHAFRWVVDSTDTLHVDGTQVISGNAGAEPLQRLRLGAGSAGGGGALLIGHIAFIGIRDQALTSQERSDLLSWSQSYYGTA